MKRILSLFVLLVTALLVACGASPRAGAGGLTPLASAGAGGLVWDPSSLREVDNPSGNIYTYAPTVIVDGSTEHIWTCHNRDSGVVKDYIYYTKRVNGSVVSSQAVLEASASGWDRVHVCDPSVLRSDVSLGGVTYQYVMFYLGNDTECSCNNSIGVAVAQNIAGPWTKRSSPLIATPDGTSTWGVGQVSATSVDGKGQFLLVYHENTSSGERTVRRSANLADLNAPSLGAVATIPTLGLEVSGENASLYINADIVYDASRDRFFVTGEQVPFPSGYPGFVDTDLHVFSIASSDLWSASGSWRYEGSVTPALTGFPRNHNSGFKRDAYGGLPNSSSLSVIFTKSCADNSSVPCNGISAEWTYDLWEISGGIGRNLVSNPQFEAASAGQTAPGWYTWSGNGSADADYTESNGYASQQRLTHWKNSSYEVFSGQDLTGLTNGLYTLRAWVVSGGGQSAAYLEVKDYGGTAQRVNVPSTGWPNWRRLEIKDINVTNSRASIGVYSNANAGNWLSIDGVEFFKQ